MAEFDRYKGKLRLHGLGFLQLHLAGGLRRLHIWHPDLPHRKCFEDSAVHNHRWGFVAQVLVGNQINVRCSVHIDEPGNPPKGDFTMYNHEGPRNEHGARAWIADGTCRIIEAARPEIICAGDVYGMRPFEYHRTPLHDKPVVTLMTKANDGDSNKGAHSICRTGVTPDEAFDSKQIPEDRLWDIVRDAMRS